MKTPRLCALVVAMVAAASAMATQDESLLTAALTRAPG